MNQIKKILKNEKGFTLVELVIVVLILGILVVIAVPRFVSATDNAKKQAQKATARTIMSAIVMAQAANPDTKAENITQDMVNEYLENITVKSKNSLLEGEWAFTYEKIGDETEENWHFWYKPKGGNGNVEEVKIK